MEKIQVLFTILSSRLSLISFLPAYAPFCRPLFIFTALQHPFTSISLFFWFAMAYIANCWAGTSRVVQDRILPHSRVGSDHLPLLWFCVCVFFAFGTSVTIQWFLRQLSHSWEHRKNTLMTRCWSQNVFVTNYIKNFYNFPVVPFSPSHAWEDTF